MHTLEELSENLQDKEWVRNNILEGIEKDSFIEIYNKEIESHTDADSEPSFKRESPYHEKGLLLEEFNQEHIGFIGTSNVWSKREIYLLKNGELAIVTTTSRFYDSGKRTSAYGEYGYYRARDVSILNNATLPIYSKRIAGDILKILKTKRQSLNNKTF